MTIPQYVSGFVLLLNIILAFFVVFQERRDAGATWAWLLVMLFVPILGFVLYMLLAQNLSRVRIFKWEDLNQSGIDGKLEAQSAELIAGRFPFRNTRTKDRSDLIYMHLINNRALFTENNAVELFTDGREKFERLIEDIREAREFIHLQYYIIRSDNLGRRLLSALTERVRAGVKVRILYDELGSRTLLRGFFREFKAAGGEVEAFFPSKLRIINTRLNYRNHRKLVVIDGRIGYTGGFNVGDEYLGLHPKFGYWRDTHLRIRGDAVHDLQARFILDWNHASHRHDIVYDPDLFPQEGVPGSTGMQIVTSGPDSELEHIKYGYIKMIHSAQHTIWIQTPYFIPDASLLDALRVACLSGIEVNIMIPDKPDHMFVYWATLSHIGEMLNLGANVYIYRNGFIHAKTLVIDDAVASVGTANIDVRSFRLNFEVNAFMYDGEIARKLTDLYREDMKVSTRLTLDDYRSRPRRIRIKESISRLLSPIL
ncbi:cardiolipin synthase [Paenibacillus sp. CN-4]|uniref:cardiolipin synthase n=1 Tax=Paenibacillus nanchangensis TaxID=3348343 RepID=UPI00397B0ADD